jgi:hypothetical protein
MYAHNICASAPSPTIFWQCLILPFLAFYMVLCLKLHHLENVAVTVCSAQEDDYEGLVLDLAECQPHKMIMANA